MNVLPSHFSMRLGSAMVAAAAIVAAAEPARAADPEVSKEVIAVQIRKQGFECKNPQSATRSFDDKADEAIWTLVCEGVRYRVILIPKMAAKVERLPDEPQSTEHTAPPQ